MGMKYRKVLLLLLTLCVSLALSGCRTRTGVSDPGKTAADSVTGLTDESQSGESTAADSAYASAQEDQGSGDAEAGGASGRTRENPDASRKEYDENAPAEIVPGTDHLLHEEGEGNGASVSNEDSEDAVSRVNDRAKETAVQTVAAPEAEERGVSEDAEAADSALEYYTVLLRDRTNSLFECQRMNVYWETDRDHVTVHKTSPEHTLILNAGCYNVSARLLPENLHVDDGWVVRKNPGVIVRIVNSGILGSGVSSDRAASAVERSLRNREGWSSIDAVKNGRILLLSRELLEAPWLQTAAMVLIAKTAVPSLFADVDADEMLRMLAEEATGTIPSGMYYYCKEDGP